MAVSISVTYLRRAYKAEQARLDRKESPKELWEARIVFAPAGDYHRVGDVIITAK